MQFLRNLIVFLVTLRLYYFVIGLAWALWEEMNSSPIERLVFRFSTCIQLKGPRCGEYDIPEQVRNASQHLLTRLSSDPQMVTVVDDGRVDWDRLLGQNNFGGGVSWYPSDFNGLSNAFSGVSTSGLEWKAIPFDCKSSKWSFDISNVQRAVPAAARFKTWSTRAPNIPFNAANYTCPRLGCTYVYVFSPAAWKKVSTKGVKGLHNIRCWAHDLCNSGRHNRKVEPAHFMAQGLSRLPDTVGVDTQVSTSKATLNYMSGNEDNRSSVSTAPSENTLPLRGSSNHALSNSTNSTSHELDTPERAALSRPPWVPPRRESLSTEPMHPEETIAESISTEPRFPRPTYSAFYSDLRGLAVHPLETVFEVDEDGDMDTATSSNLSSMVADNERADSLGETGDDRPSQTSIYVGDAPMETQSSDLVEPQPPKFSVLDALRRAGSDASRFREIAGAIMFSWALNIGVRMRRLALLRLRGQSPRLGSPQENPPSMIPIVIESIIWSLLHLWIYYWLYLGIEILLNQPWVASFFN